MAVLVNTPGATPQPMRLGPRPAPTGSGRPGLGPRPAPPAPDARHRLSTPRALVLERLAQYPEGATVAELAEASAQHPNTVREHLDSLVRHGLVSRTTAPAKGRGRPAIIYLAEPQLPAEENREYALLVGAFADHIAATADDPRAWGLESGERFGRALAGERAEGGVAAAESMARLMLDRHGYDPVDAPDGTLRLRQCPRYSLVQRHPELVCGQHQGEILGIYAAHGVDTSRAMRITPFALPGCCLIEFPPDPDAGPPVPPDRPVRHRRTAAASDGEAPRAD